MKKALIIKTGRYLSLLVILALTSNCAKDLIRDNPKDQQATNYIPPPAPKPGNLIFDHLVIYDPSGDSNSYAPLGRNAIVRAYFKNTGQTVLKGVNFIPEYSSVLSSYYRNQPKDYAPGQLQYVELSVSCQSTMPSGNMLRSALTIQDITGKKVGADTLSITFKDPGFAIAIPSYTVTSDYYGYGGVYPGDESYLDLTIQNTGNTAFDQCYLSDATTSDANITILEISSRGNLLYTLPQRYDDLGCSLRIAISSTTRDNSIVRFTLYFMPANKNYCGPAIKVPVSIKVK